MGLSQLTIFFCQRFRKNSLSCSGGQGWASLEARKAKAKIGKQMAGVYHTGILSSKRMANWLRINGQFWMGAVHFLVMFMVAR